MTTGTLTKSTRRDTTQKDNRDRLFQFSKPTIRQATRDDTVWIRVNQRINGIEMDDGQFNDLIQRAFVQYSEVMIIEDNNARFGSKFGPMGIVTGKP